VNNNRIGVSLNGTQQSRTVFDGANPYMDFNGSGTLTERYLTNPMGLSQFYGQVNASGAVQWFLTDNIGSIRQVVSGGGASLDAITYDPFGNIVSQTNSSNAPRFGYTGGAVDSLTGNVQDDARYYRPADGDFASEDPWRFRAGDTNLFRYVFNAPMSASDPSGLLYTSVSYSSGTSFGTQFWDEVAGYYNNQTFGLSNQVLNSKWFGTAFNQTDRFFAGWGNVLTGGLLTHTRDFIYGDSATQNHQGTLFNIGQYVGYGHSIAMTVAGGFSIVSSFRGGAGIGGAQIIGRSGSGSLALAPATGLVVDTTTLAQGLATLGLGGLGILHMSANQPDGGGPSDAPNSGGNGPQPFEEQFDSLADAIGEINEDLVQIVDEVPTNNDFIRSQGFTKTIYAVGSDGEQVTVFYNPTTGKFAGAH
jgi:RHS repeat-associated protein